MENNIKNKKGITLIALVITIIVLLILAGVSISMISSQEGILNKATNAKKKNEEANFVEQVKLAAMAAMINENAELNETSLKNELKKIEISEENIVEDGNGGYIIKKGEESANINNNGEVNELEGIKDIDIELERHFKNNNLKYKCRYGYITGITIGEKVEDLNNALNETDYTVSTVDTTARLTTGMTIEKEKGKPIATIIIFGDVNDDGEIGIADGNYVQAFCNGGTLKEYQILAADVNHDGIIKESSSIISNKITELMDKLGECEDEVEIEKLESQITELKKQNENDAQMIFDYVVGTFQITQNSYVENFKNMEYKTEKNF